MKPSVIILRGPLGIGKSTIAKELARQIHADYLSIDEVLEKNKLDRIDENLGCIHLENFIKTNKIIIPSLTTQLKDKSVIIDGNFYHKEQIEDLIKNLEKFKIFVFTLKAPLDICIKRDSERTKSYGKDAAKAVYNLVSKFDYGMNINTQSKTIKEVVEEVIKNIKNKNITNTFKY